MATGSFIAVTPGSGAKLATGPTYTENANVVQDEKVILGEQYLAGYVATTGAIAVATANDHLLQIMAGASLKVRIRRIQVDQFGLPAAGATLALHLFRLASAGTGGTVNTPVAIDPADAASGATAMSLPTVKGTESGNPIRKMTLGLVSANPVTLQNTVTWVPGLNQKSIVIVAGTGNGVAIKLVAGSVATATVVVTIDFDEASF